jgi:hypothetical protein
MIFVSLCSWRGWLYKVKLWSYYKELSCFFHTHFKINKILQKLYTPFKTDNKEYGVVQQKYIFMPQFVSKQSNILELQNTFHLYANVQSIVLQNIALWRLGKILIFTVGSITMVSAVLQADNINDNDEIY